MGTYGLGARDRCCCPMNDGTEGSLCGYTLALEFDRVGSTAGRNDELELERELAYPADEGASAECGPPPAEINKLT